MKPIKSLYLHIPFCTWVCKYCDFTTYAVLEGMMPAYVEALCLEIQTAARRYELRPLRTVYFGGGTPSLLGPNQIARILQTVRECTGLTEDAEITLEANPSNVTAKGAAAWRSQGITRLSIGVQSLKPAALRFLERLHSGPEALGAVRAARAAGFRNVNCDLLYGVPGVSTAEWVETLDAVLAQGPTHISAYELTVEPNTRLAQEVRCGEVVMPDAELQLTQYWAATVRLRAAGFEHYEISNWGLPGCRCIHNLAYWEYRPYLGCGAGAHSLLRHDDGRSERFWNRKGLRAYVERIQAIGEAVEDREILSPERALGEAAMIGIRLLKGTRAAVPFEAERRQLVVAGLLLQDGETVRLTTRGVELANQVGAVFLR